MATWRRFDRAVEDGMDWLQEMLDEAMEYVRRSNGSSWQSRLANT